MVVFSPEKRAGVLIARSVPSGWVPYGRSEEESPVHSTKGGIPGPLHKGGGGIYRPNEKWCLFANLMLMPKILKDWGFAIHLMETLYCVVFLAIRYSCLRAGTYRSLVATSSACVKISFMFLGQMFLYASNARQTFCVTWASNRPWGLYTSQNIQPGY